MSPKSLFNRVPLIFGDIEIMQPLAAFEHQLWLMRYGVKQLVCKAESLVREIEERFAELSANLPEFCDDYHDRLKIDLPKWKKFSEACFQLSDCLSEFPRRIEVL